MTTLPITMICTGRAPGVAGPYDHRYITAAIEGVDRVTRGECHAEILTTKDLHPRLQDRGRWSMLALYDPHLKAGTDSTIYATGIDTVFIGDLLLAMHEASYLDADIVGMRDFLSLKWGDGLLRIKKRSDGALLVWDAVLRLISTHEWNAPGWRGHDGLEQDFVARSAGAHRLGFIADRWCQSYKVHAGMIKELRTQTRLNEAAVLQFHGKPKPHDVIEKRLPLWEFTCAHWRPDG